MTCPTCGADADGKFCSNCGATLAAQRCPGCDAEVTPGAHFCPVCGRPLGAGRAARSAVPWVVAGAMVAALAAVLLIRLTAPRSGLAASGTPALSSADGGMGAVATTDISSMTPRERADRLFNRVMAAAERHDTTETQFFGPMAVQAYALLGTLDADARYHLGMIQLAQGDAAGARAQVDSIARQHATHLLGTLLRAEIAGRARDAATRDRAWRELLRNWDREMATGRSEYADHLTALEAARAEAERTAGGRGGGDRGGGGGGGGGAR